MTILLQGAGLQVASSVTPPDPGATLRADVIRNFSLNNTLIDSAGKGVDLVLGNNVGGNPTFVAGHFNQAMRLIADISHTQWAICADAADIRFGDFDWTFDLWVYLTHETTDGDQAILIKGIGPAEGDPPLEVNLEYARADNTWYFYDAADFIEPPSETFSYAAWHYLVCWYDATAHTLNIKVDNGTTYSTPTSAPPTVGTADMYIGIYFSQGNYGFGVDGMIQEISRWNRKLTQDEIDWRWNSGAGRSLYP